MEISIKIENVDEINRYLKERPARTKEELNRAVKKAVIQVDRQARLNSPVSPGGGRLKSSIHYRTFETALEGEVYTVIHYAIYVHEGTRPHIIRAIRARSLYNKRTGQFFGPIVHHPGTRPNPFLAKAAKEMGPQIQRYFQEAITNVLEK